MNKFIATIAMLLVGICVVLENRVSTFRNENQRLIANQSALLEQYEIVMAESQRYKVSDSLNAATVAALKISLEEYKKHFSEDYETIKNLKHSKSSLQAIISAQTETIVQLKTEVQQDTITAVTDTLKCFNYESAWTNASGCFNLADNTVELQIKNKESLKVVETVTYKRFLGFLWKTNKVKSRQVDILSENPATQILNVSYINIAN